MHKTVTVCTGFPYYFHCNLHSWVAFLIHVLAGLSHGLSPSCARESSVINRSTGSTGTDRNALENALDTTAYIRNFLDPV